MQSISFSSGGIKLQGNLFIPKGGGKNSPAVLVIHGWTSRQDRHFGLAEALAKAGYVCLTFDLRGHGVSEGDIKDYSRKEFLDDMIAAYDYLSKVPGVDAKNVTAIGSSFGSYLSALLSSKRDCKALVLRVPANYPDKGFDEPHYPVRHAIYSPASPSPLAEWKLEPHTYQEVSSLRALHDFKGRILIVESEKDETVPQQCVKDYANAVVDTTHLTYVVMRGALHSISKD